MQTLVPRPELCVAFRLCLTSPNITDGERESDMLSVINLVTLALNVLKFLIHSYLLRKIQPTFTYIGNID